MADVAGFACGARTVFRRELEAYFDSTIAYVYASVFLGLAATIFMNSFFLNSLVDMGPYFATLPFLLIPLVPAITMRSWAEERAQNTFELLMTLPLTPIQLVLGKYLSACCFFALVLCGSFPIVLMLFWLGEPDGGLIFTSYLGALFLGALFLAFGQFVSSLTHDQIVAFILAALFGFVFVLSGHDKVVEVVDGLAPQAQIGTWLYESISVMPHYEAFGRGLISAADILYFGLLISFFIWMNALSLQRSKY
jgi:ABC-2 type transport system permease protein